MWKAVACFVLVLSSVWGRVAGSYDNYFALEADYVLLRRANSHNKHLVSAAGVFTGTLGCDKLEGKAFIETKDLIHDMGFNSGFSAAVKAFPSIWSTWELRYTGGFNWKGQKNKSCPGNLNLDGSLAFETVDYQFADRVKSRLRSDMYTPEFNFWRHMTPRYLDHFSVSWMAGLRYFRIDEKLKLFFTKNNQTSRYRLKTDDKSFGLQLGGMLEYNPYHFLTWGVAVKVGGLYNRGRVQTLMEDEGNTVTIRDQDRSGSNFAYMAQIYPYLEIRPTRHFFFNINYQVLYVGNVVTADRNVRFHGTHSIFNHHGHILYHGFTGGLQFNF